MCRAIQQLSAGQRRRPQTAGRELDRSLAARFLSLDASYGTAFQEYWTLARVGYRVDHASRLGSKAARLAMRNMMRGAEASSGMDLRNVEITVSGGFTGNYLEDEPSGYASLGVYRAF